MCPTSCRHAFHDLGRECEYFTVMRHPIDRAVSAFYYCPTDHDLRATMARPPQVIFVELDFALLTDERSHVRGRHRTTPCLPAIPKPLPSSRRHATTVTHMVDGVVVDTLCVGNATNWCGSSRWLSPCGAALPN